ncbi:hypothetical protein [Sanguibacteroides justesenii]|nr:hypothetical protein [Sanguibacteroides justesenii]
MIKIVGSVLVICTLIIILSAGSQNRYKVSQLRGKWQMETGSPRPDQIIREFIHGTCKITRLQNGDTVIHAKYWFYLSDSAVTAFDWRLVTALTSGKYMVVQYGEDLTPPYEFPCDVFKILTLNRDSLVMQYVPKKGQVMIGGGPVTYKRISD